MQILLIILMAIIAIGVLISSDRGVTMLKGFGSVIVFTLIGFFYLIMLGVIVFLCYTFYQHNLVPYGISVYWWAALVTLVSTPFIVRFARQSKHEQKN